MIHRICHGTPLILMLLIPAGCGKSRESIEQEAKVLQRVGDARVGAVSVTGSDLASVEPTLKKINDAPNTVRERVDACRRVNGIPATLELETPVPIKDLREELGPFSAETKRKYRDTEITSYVYGDLEVGLSDGKIVAVRVNK
jgi:hypothetical protein